MGNSPFYHSLLNGKDHEGKRIKWANKALRLIATRELYHYVLKGKEFYAD